LKFELKISFHLNDEWLKIKSLKIEAINSDIAQIANRRLHSVFTTKISDMFLPENLKSPTHFNNISPNPSKIEISVTLILYL
jgi:hypothetical protein